MNLAARGAGSKIDYRACRRVVVALRFVGSSNPGSDKVTEEVKNSWWWGDGMPRPLCWIWHKANWVLTGRAGYSQCWRCGRCNRTWVEDLWS
jgi:hypothetical protein